MKKIPVWFAAVLLALGLGLLVPAPAPAATPYCGLTWGSLAKSGHDPGAATVTNVRTGQHYCFDRLVVDLSGPAVPYTVQYVPRIAQEGSGAIIPVRGGARLHISIQAPSYDQDGNPTYNPADRNELSNVSGYQTIRQVVSAGSFEGYTSLGLGVRARLPFRVFTLAGPGAGSRLVIDVAHYW